LILGKYEEIGRLGLDLNHLKDEIEPRDMGRGKMRYVVEVIVKLKVIDRDLEFKVVRPKRPGARKGETVQGSQKFSMVGSFAPGASIN
jgi:hypothetical protein